MWTRSNWLTHCKVGFSFLYSQYKVWYFYREVFYMVKKVSGGYKVFSEKGKPLSRTYTTKAQAQNRLREIEYWKNKGK